MARTLQPGKGGLTGESLEIGGEEVRRPPGAASWQHQPQLLRHGRLPLRQRRRRGAVLLLGEGEAARRAAGEEGLRRGGKEAPVLIPLRVGPHDLKDPVLPLEEEGLRHLLATAVPPGPGGGPLPEEVGLYAGVAGKGVVKLLQGVAPLMGADLQEGAELLALGYQRLPSCRQVWGR